MAAYTAVATGSPDRATPSPPRRARPQFCEYSIAEQLADRICHVFWVTGSTLGMVCLILMASRYSNALMETTFAVYGGTLVLSFLASTVYHEVRRLRLKAVLRVVDHAAIYLLIAGTYTPITLVSLGGAWGWTLFAVEWGIAALGIALKLIYPWRYEGLSIALYLALGWAGLVALGKLITNVPWPGLVLMGAGGLLVTVGVYFYAWARFRFHNLVWHVFVLAAATCHVCMMLFYIRAPS